MALLLLLASPAGAWAPLDGGDGPVRWPAAAPLPLGDGPLVWQTAAAEWTAVADAGFAPRFASVPLGPDGTVAFSAVADPEAWRALVGDPSLVGFTLTTHEGEALLDADVLLNEADHRFSDAEGERAWHRPTVLAHELGHVLGLGHSCEGPACEGLDGPEPLMHPRLEPGLARAAGADDLAGIEVVFPWRGPVRRPRVCATRPTGAGATISTNLEIGDRARAWTDAPRPIAAGPELDLPALPAQLELWTGEGQGLVTPVAPPPTPSGEPARPRPAGGCATAPLAALSMLIPLMARRRPRLGVTP